MPLLSATKDFCSASTLRGALCIFHVGIRRGLMECKSLHDLNKQSSAFLLIVNFVH